MDFILEAIHPIIINGRYSKSCIYCDSAFNFTVQHSPTLSEGRWVAPCYTHQEGIFCKVGNSWFKPTKVLHGIGGTYFQIHTSQLYQGISVQKKKKKQKQCCRGAWGAWRFHRLVSKFVSLATLDQSPHLNALYQTELTPFDANASWGGKNPAKKWVWSYRAMNWQYLTQAELCRKNV